MFDVLKTWMQYFFKFDLFFSTSIFQIYRMMRAREFTESSRVYKAGNRWPIGSIS